MKMHSRTRYMYDAATEASLRAKSAAAITASTAGAALVLDTLQGYWTTGELADNTLAVVANVNAIDNGTGDETYKLDVKTNNGIVVGTATVKALGQYVILLDMDTVRLSDPTAVSISLDATIAGTTPSLDFFAWIAPVKA